MGSVPKDSPLQFHLDGMWPNSGVDSILARLERRFEHLRAKLVSEHEGRWALVTDRGSRLVPGLRIFDDQWDAIDAGYLDLDRRRFCVKQILEVDEPVVVRPAGF